MKDDESNSIANMFIASMTELKNSHTKVYELIIARAKEGFFEQHQTTGTMKALANEILKVAHQRGGSDESK
jgi:hypothetical protein